MICPDDNALPSFDRSIRNQILVCHFVIVFLHFCFPSVYYSYSLPSLIIFIIRNLRTRIAHAVNYEALVCHLKSSFQIERLLLVRMCFIYLFYSICLVLQVGIFFRLHDLGLRQHDKASLLVELLIPTLFSIALVIQLHFFHKPMTMKINHLLILRKQSKGRSRFSSPPPEHIEEQEPSTSGIKQQAGAVAPDAAAATDSEQDTEKTEGEMTTLFKFLWFYKNTTKILWRIAEIHAVKGVSLIIMLVVVQQVSIDYCFRTILFCICNKKCRCDPSYETMLADMLFCFDSTYKRHKNLFIHLKGIYINVFFFFKI